MARGRIEFRQYVPQATRQSAAKRATEAAANRGGAWTPVKAEPRTRTITTTVWGAAWCENLERYRDYANRLPRGRTYIRNGSVVHLEIASGKIVAKVNGSSMYDVEIHVARVAPARWEAIVATCAGDIGSLVEVLEGRLSAAVMGVMTAARTGLFPEPREISLKCSCPDSATMCKHVAAVMYGVGVRLDRAPALLFALRGVDPGGLVSVASTGRIVGAPGEGEGVLAVGDLADIFGIELVEHGSTMPVTQLAKAKTRAKPKARAKAKAKPKAPAKARTAGKAIVDAKVPAKARTPAKTARQTPPERRR